MKLNEQIIPIESMLLAGLSDKVTMLLWAKTEDGQKGKNRPPLILDSFNQKDKNQKDTVVFSSGEDFEQTRRKLLTQAESGGED